MKINISKKRIELITIIYIYIPIILYLFGWTKLWIAVINTCAIFFVTSSFFNKNVDDEYVNINTILLIGVVVFFLFIGFSVGWGRWTNQVWDWEKHNAVLADLVNKDWPVYYNNKGEKSYLSYYIGQYLFPAVFGRITGSVRCAEIGMFIWCVLGLIVVYLNAIRILKFSGKLMQVMTAFLLVFFSLPRELAKFVLDVFTKFSSSVVVFYEDQTMRLEYTDNIFLFEYAIPQVIVIWMIMLLFLDNRKQTKFYLFMIVPSLLFGTFGTLGMIVFAVVQCVSNFTNGSGIKNRLLEMFSIENILIALTLVPVIVLYLWGNLRVAKPSEVGFRLVDYSGDRVMIYLIFIIFNVFSIAIPLLKDNKKNLMFYAAIGSLATLPLCMMGKYNDLMMRASIPSLFFLSLLVLQFLQKHVSCDTIINDIIHINTVDKNKKYNMKDLKHFLSVIYMCFILSFGISFGCKIVYRQVTDNKIEELGTLPSLNGDEPINSLEKWANRSDDNIGKDQRYNYFAYDYEDDMFYNYLARK